MEHLGRYRWRKSSYSGNGGTDCVEVGAPATADRVLVRDTKDCGGPVLRREHGHWIKAVAPDPNASVVMSMATISPQNVWAVTSTRCGSGVALEHWNGRRWASAWSASSG